MFNKLLTSEDICLHESRQGHDRKVVGFTTTFVPVQSVPITDKVVSLNPAQERCTQYNIM